MEYRREINGLRALAVIPVILYHAGFSAFSGGFVGVDVFFVISGYLITTIILADLEVGKFSIINFYERRARRILPALFLVMLVCIPFAWLWLLPSDMKDFSQSLVAVSVFSSNILFLRENGYFDTAAELKPLLHTWSLAVEEQYYVLFPLFLMLTWRLGKRWILVLLAIVAIASLAVAQWAPLANPAEAFYLLPTRGWELLIGAFAAFYLSKANRSDFSRGVGEVGGSLGLALIFYSVFAYSKATPFPGLYALVPTVGTVLIILFATQQTTIGKFIGNRYFVGIGLVSFSAYLWHQPLFAFARNSLSEPSYLVFSVLSVVALVLAYFSWRYVETPFRNKQRFSRKKIFIYGVIGSFLFDMIGLIGNFNNGFIKKLEHVNVSVKVKDPLLYDIYVLGDSHANHLISGLEIITKGKVYDFTSSGCIPFRDVDRYDYRFVPGDCSRKMNSYLDNLQILSSKSIVILSSMGPVYLDGTPFNGKDSARVTGLGVELVSNKSIKDRWEVYETGLRNTLTELSTLDKVKVVFAIDIPELGIDNGCNYSEKEINLGFFILSDSVKKNKITAASCNVKRFDYNKRNDRYKKLVRLVISEFPNVILFDPTNAFCDEMVCRGVDPTFGFLYKDIDHLSYNGSLYYALNLKDFLSANKIVEAIDKVGATLYGVK